MRTAIRVPLIAAIVVCGTVGIVAPIAELVAQVSISAQHPALMERKLESAQGLLAGISKTDYELIAKEAQTLHLLSREAGWNAIQTPEYSQLSDSFRSTAAQLERAAKDQNMDAVGLAYIKLTISCIDCHRYAFDHYSN